MRNTAQSIRTRLSVMNRNYLALMYLHDTEERRCMKFDPDRRARITYIRNEIVELQSKLKNVEQRKGVSTH